MRRIRFSVSAVILAVVFLAMAFSLIQQTRLNLKLIEENRRMGRQLGIPFDVDPGKLYSKDASAVPLTEPYSWAWRVYIPEGTRYRLYVRSENIPIRPDHQFPKGDDPLFELEPGETLVRVWVKNEVRNSTLIVATDWGRHELDFDASFLREGYNVTYGNGGPKGENPGNGIAPPDTVQLYRNVKDMKDDYEEIGGTTYVKHGLLVWLERIPEEEDTSRP